MALSKKERSPKIKKKLSSDEIKQRNIKNRITMFVVIYIFLSFYAMHMGHAAYLTENPSVFHNSVVGQKANIFQDTITASVTIVTTPFDILPFSKYHLKYWIIITAITLMYGCWQYIKYMRFKSDREGETHGTARWNTDYEEFHEKYTIEPKAAHGEDVEHCLDMNLIITSKNKLSFDNRTTKRNNNVVILGGSGTGKSQSYILPNMAQFNSSLILTDPSGELYETMNKPLLANGYDVKVLNLLYPNRGNKYNPFDYIRRKEDGSCDETSVMAMVASFLNNTEGKNKKEEGFWRDSAEALFCASAFLLIETRPYHDWTMANVSKLIRQAKKNAADTSSDSPFDYLMKEAGAKNPNSMAYSFYQTYKLANDKTAESILVSTDVKLSKFSIPEINDLTSTDLDNLDNNINLNTIADKKTALFIITKTGGGPYDFLASMLYSQLFDLLYDRAGVINPSRHHIYNRYDYPVETMFKTEIEAKNYIEDIQKATIIEEPLGNEQYKYFLKKEDGKYVMARKYEMNSDLEKFYKNKRMEFATKEKAQAYLDEYKAAYVKQTGMRLPWAVSCLLDEFNNIQEIPKFDEILATCRKYNINISIVLQNLAQLQGRYKDAWQTILGNCDNFLFLGSNDKETAKYVSDILGSATIENKNVSRSSTDLGKANYSIQAMARLLLTPDEVSRLDNSECIYVMRGELPFKVKKMKFETHKNYKQTGGYDESLKTSTEEMKKQFTRKKAKKHKVASVYETQKLEKAEAIQSPKDLQSMLNTYTAKQAKEAVKQPKENYKNKMEKLSEEAQSELNIVVNDGTEEMLF